MELHTVSPNSGYKQEDIVQMAYIMTGWRHKWGKKRLETGDVHFDSSEDWIRAEAMYQVLQKTKILS